MRLLVLGGTRFVGPALVDAALARGWDVTVFNRGRSAVEPSVAGLPPDPARGSPPGVHVLRGDRRDAAGLRSLSGQQWDVVVDTWSGAPAAVRDVARVLAGRVGHYVYVSSRSVYRWPQAAGADESAPLVDADPDAEATEYPADKRGAELAACRELGAQRVALLRAGLILGPGENVGRLPWWLTRIAAGGQVLAPGPADLPLQYVDARDLAAFALHLGETGFAGGVDGVSPSGHATMAGLLQACVSATGSAASLEWVPAKFLVERGVTGWTDLPVWGPPGELHDAMHRSDASAAQRAGLRCRPVTGTVADTWAWLCGVGGRLPARAGLPAPGLPPGRERELLEEWTAAR